MTTPRISPLIALALLSLATPARADDGRPPNVVLILADDLGWGDLGCNGRKEWATPNLDGLARSGTRFTRFYTSAVVCAPSRAALMTGKSTIHDGVTANNHDLPASEVTIAQALKARGYATAMFGKWHQGAPRPPAKVPVHPLDRGFDEFVGFVDAVHAWEHFPKVLWHGREKKPASGYACDTFTDLAIDFLERKKAAPFFLYLPYIETHLNIEAPADEVARHAGKFAEADPAHPLNATYAAMVTRLDRNVGRLLAALDRLDLAGNTLVVFASDHGATFEAGNKGTSAFHDSNAPFRGQKRTLWEGGIRVPGIVRWPGHILAGAASRDLVQTIDLMPTLLAASGAPTDTIRGLDGVDLLPVWTGRAKAPDRTLFWEWRSEGFHQVAAMRGDFKLVVTQNGRPELYNVENDPAERRSLAAQYPGKVRTLNDSLRAWLATETIPGDFKPFPGKATAWNGFDRHDFAVGGLDVTVVSPRTPLPGRPWLWRGEFFGAFANADIELVKRGWHLAYVRVPDLFGAPRAIRAWEKVHESLVKTYGLHPRPGLIGLSRGGLYCMNWGAAHPEKTMAIYLDAAVCDFRSWPGGKEKGLGVAPGSVGEWEKMMEAYGFKDDAEAIAWKGNPVDRLEPLAAAKIPILLIYGEADQVVPWRENSDVVYRRYKALGGPVERIPKPGVDHHPHGLPDPAPVVEFFEKARAAAEKAR